MNRQGRPHTGRITVPHPVWAPPADLFRLTVDCLLVETQVGGRSAQGHSVPAGNGPVGESV